MFSTFGWMRMAFRVALLAAVAGFASIAGYGLFARSVSSVSSSESTVEHTVAQAVEPAAASRLYLPVQTNYPLLSRRMGFGSAGPLHRFLFDEIETLRAGWYLDWSVNGSPARPNGMKFVQTVRLHQDIECPIGSDYNRERCPYVVPHSYTVRPSLGQIGRVARQRPGSIWLIGNEMDRMDWGRPGSGFGGNQDEMLPELYAEAYHEIYWGIKNNDPTAKVAIGGIIQPTPLRMEYLTTIWDTYRARYGVDMPVDVWNTHNFILREGANSDWGAGVPPGASQTTGEYVGLRDADGNRTYHIDMELFDKQIRVFRTWMKERGQQQKPLIVSEYGVLYPNYLIFINGKYANTDPQPVIDFMLATFDYFLHTRDCEIGFHGDDCRLVQAWNWFVLNSTDTNLHARLFNQTTGEITPAGNAFREYSRTNILELSRPFPIP